MSQSLIRNVLKTVTDTRLDPGRTFLRAAMGFRLAPSYLTFDDLEGSKIKVILFDVKCHERQQLPCWTQQSLHRVPMGFTLNDLERVKVKVTILWFEIS